MPFPETYYLTKEEYLAVKAVWSAMSKHSPQDLIIYNILRGKPVKNGFKESTKQILGNNPWFTLDKYKMLAYFKMPESNSRFMTRHPAYIDRKIDISKSEFKSNFGIDIPIDLTEKIKTEN